MADRFKQSRFFFGSPHELLIKRNEVNPLINQTVITEFILLGFGDHPELHVLFFLLFLVIYIITVMGNLLIVVLIVTDRHLHIPMYFFLGNLSCLEICYTSTILPRMLASFLTGNRAISLSGCFIQLYLFGFLVTAETCLLSVMSYDRYLAICKPFQYQFHMNNKVCISLAAGSWISGCFSVSIVVVWLSQLSYCGFNGIDHFFCDFVPLSKLACSDTSLIMQVALLLCSVFTFPPFILTIASYICIISVILRIPSTTGRQKAFSTCSSHLLVVTIFYGTLMIVYLLPEGPLLKGSSKVFSFFYTVMTPMINPLIYSLRNKEVKEGLRKWAQKFWSPLGL
ncbi:olfactory receptor 11A1-like [Eublepharis macularius]|uniref:Olfactory receptor n=1 Tax=Eublepharis macularius TaxID=481883 RepID=A0AA97K783_EUBMA|nr:olfactory receptor 11A1-like [Eublepharis macularius]